MEISLSPEILFYIGSLPVSNTLFWSTFLSLFLIIGILLIARSLKPVPGRVQCFFEILLDGALDFIRSVTGDDKKAKKVFPLVFTMFIFIATANLITLIPGQAAFTLAKESGGTVPIFRAIMSDYAFVFVLTMISVLTIQVVSIITYGPFGYLLKFFNFKNLLKNPLKFPLDFFLGIMDLVGEIAKILSLSFRLFGNIFAGEVLSAVMLSLLPFFGPLPFMILGLLTAVVQAFVFSVLTLVFISMASEMEEPEAA